MSNNRQTTKPSNTLPKLDLYPNQISVVYNEIKTSLSHITQALSDVSKTENEISTYVFQNVATVKTKIERLGSLSDSPETTFDIIQTILKSYIKDILSVKMSIKILSNSWFQEIFLLTTRIETTLNLKQLFENKSDYARIVFSRSFDLLALPPIKDFLNDQYPLELSKHMSNILFFILRHIEFTMEYIVFKKDDFQNEHLILPVFLTYIDKHKQDIGNVEINETVKKILRFLWTISDKTILVPRIIQMNLPPYVLKWISMKHSSIEIQQTCINIIHNIARHEEGIKVLNEAECLKILKEFKQLVLDPNKDNDDEIHVELRLVYCMALSLLAEPKENRDSLDNLRKILDQLIQSTVDAGQTTNSMSHGFHVSEPIVVLSKLFVHDEILEYVLNESSIKNMQTDSKIDIFCQLIMKFRGALTTENSLDQLTLTALFNIIWSISFHERYSEKLKSNSKLMMTIKSLASDEGENLIEQYVPQYMSSIGQAADGILKNLHENNPARPIRSLEANVIEENTIKSNDKIYVMISYSHADKDFCVKLVKTLQNNKRLDVWVDFANCHTEDFWEEIAEAIEKSHVVLFLMSKDYQDSKSCRQEVMYAKDSLKKRFIPIYIKKEFTARGWLGVRVVGPQHVRFEKRPFDETAKELIKLICNDENKSDGPTVINTETSLSINTSTVPNGQVGFERKPIDTWRKNDIINWSNSNNIQHELIDLYDFQYGNELYLYGECLRPDWQIEYEVMRRRYEQKYNTPLYRDQFVRFVGAINRLEQSRKKSRLCIIS